LARSCWEWPLQQQQQQLLALGSTTLGSLQLLALGSTHHAHGAALQLRRLQQQRLRQLIQQRRPGRASCARQRSSCRSWRRGGGQPSAALW
jgi:hypothetical protein